MKSTTSVYLGAALLCLGLLTTTALAQRAAEPAMASSHETPAADGSAAVPSTPEGFNAVVGEYCATCHSERAKAGGLSLASFNVADAAEHADVSEAMIRKLRAGMMPPPGAKRPEPAVYDALTTTLETLVDTAAAANPNPGIRTFQRLNRPEYSRAIRDLLGLEVDAGDWLPLDTMSVGFDNMADEQKMSPMLLDSYLNAAADISRMAVGNIKATPVDHTYTNPSYVSQHPWDHVEGAPYGTRGGMVVDHVFPADGEYIFELRFVSGNNTRFEDVDVSIDGERVAFIPYEVGDSGGADGRGGDPVRTEPILVRAGQHKVAAAFVRKMDGPYEDLIRPHEWSYAGGGSGGVGITTLPHLRDVIIQGPYNVTGISDTPSRERIFTCRPTTVSEEAPCAAEIVGQLAARAYRRPVTTDRFERLMAFYEEGRKNGDFELGIRTALEAILASPYFVFRFEQRPESVTAGTAYRVNDVDLASRLSFFLWGTPPDAELLEIASAGKLTDAEIEKQTRRMLADPRAEALGTRFAHQWLRLQDVDKVRPDPNFFPNFDENLASLMKRETELFFYNLVREDRSALELLTADYTFLNERLARHYGFSGVAGTDFQRFEYPGERRRGVLGQGSVLVLTSMANRTSPVLRGKWVMEVLLGTPPPPPPPNVPDLEATEGSKDGRLLTTRERLEAHAANPACSSCHRFMDPIGLALDAFDVTAQWRVRENGMPLDTSGVFYDGTSIKDLNDLSAVLMKRPEALVRNMTENLLAFALGRRVEYFDQPLIRAITREAKANDYHMSSFILGVVMSDAFQMKKAEPITTTAGPNGRP